MQLFTPTVVSSSPTYRLPLPQEKKNSKNFKISVTSKKTAECRTFSAYQQLPPKALNSSELPASFRRANSSQGPANCSKIIKEERISFNLLSSSTIPTAIHNSILFFCYHENSSLYTRKRGKRRLQRKATLRTSTAHLDSFDMPKALLLERYYLSQDFFFKYKFSE